MRINAKAKACKFIKENLENYQRYQNHRVPSFRTYAYVYLGRAMHTIMDSTSPVHRGFQEWCLISARSHGPFESRLENSISRSDLNRTVDLMKRALAGEKCECIL